MAYTTIKKPSDYFNTVTYTGNGAAARSITGVGFQPDWVWVKDRSVGYPHITWDSGRTNKASLCTNTADAEVTTTARTLTSFDSDGFTTPNVTGDIFNDNGTSFVSWNWKANGAGVTNTDGSITSTVSANTTSGFSIVTYTGNGTANSTVGHGLGTIPEFIIVKGRSAGGTAWGTKNPAYNSPSDPRVLYLNNSNSYDSAQNVWGSSASFTTSTFTVGDWVGSNSNSTTYVAYCFSSKTGYSKFGLYTGNGNADGPFIYTGFKPAFVMIKSSSQTETTWVIVDNKREGYNPDNDRLFPDTVQAESTSDVVDLLSNGFKLRSGAGSSNGPSYTHIYMAFAEEPLVGDNPATAR